MGNLVHSRLRPFGDPPTGTYVVSGSLPPGNVHPRRPGRFGKLGALVLDATSGEALDAKRNGRDHVVLHGGPRNAKRRLRRTRGGFRVSDHKLAALLAAINRTHLAGDPLTEIEVVDVPSQSKFTDWGSQIQRTTVGARGSAAAIAAMALFGVSRASPTRRSFLASALLAVVSTRLLAACDDRPERCVLDCRTHPGSGSGSGSGSGMGAGSGSGSGSGSASADDRCVEVCDGDDYGTGGGVG